MRLGGDGVENSTDLLTPIAVAPAQVEKEEKKPAGTETPEQKDLFVRAQRRKLPDERKSRGSLYQDGEGRFHPVRVHGWPRTFDLRWPAVWRAAQGDRGQVDEYSF